MSSINPNRALGNTGDIFIDDKLRNTNSFLEIGRVESVDSVLGNITVSIGKEIIPIRINGLSQRSGSINLYMPVIGDLVWVYRDATVTTILGYPISDQNWVLQDLEVSKNLSITQPRLLRPMESGNQYIRSSQGGSVFLNDNVYLQDAAGSSIELDSNQDKIEFFSSSIEQNMLYSEIKSGLVKRYNPNLNPTYDSIIFNPNSSANLPMSEFTVFLGKSLKKELSDISNYLTGSDSDPNYKNVDFDEGKENKPKLTLSLSDNAVVDINGEFFPTFENLKLNVLLEIADYFAFKVNTQGSFLLGKAGESGINGIYVSNDTLNPYASLGLDKGNQITFRKDESASFENKKGFYRIMQNGLLQLSADGKVLVNMDPSPGSEKFEIILSTSPNMIVTADSNGVSINAGGNILKLGGGKMQFNGEVFLGQPLISGTLGRPYEGAILGDSFITQLNTLCASLSSLVTALSTPLLGAAAWPQVNAAASTAIPVINSFISQLTSSISTGSPFISKQVKVSG
jgi:hypothetical protein